MISLPAAILASSALMGAGSFLGGRESSKSYKDAARKQLLLEMLMSQWGWGYPDWMKDILASRAQDIGDYRDELQRAYEKLYETYHPETGEYFLAEPTEEYIAALEQGGTKEAYEELAKNEWNRAMRSLEEIPGMTSGARTAAQASIASDLGDLLTKAGILGEQERIQRAGSIYGAKGTLAEEERLRRDILEELARKYTEVGMALPSEMENVQFNRLTQAMGLSSRAPQNIPWPGMSSPSLLTSLLGSTGATLNQLATYYGMKDIFNLAPKTPTYNVPSISSNTQNWFDTMLGRSSSTGSISL
ncbi:MAG: hypothetical protein J7K15_12225 [Deltaproteobacteria bacterium]|nr:hypothetical protein [Deltaproteobacteria bacterium]